MTDLDHTNICILNHLQLDARMSIKELAHKVHIAPTAVSKRIKYLQDEGYIRSFTTILNREKFNGNLLIMALVQLSNHSSSCLTEFKNATKGYKEVLECLHIAGQFDFCIKIMVRNMSEYDKFLATKLATLADFKHVQSQIVLSEAKSETMMRLGLS